MTDPNQVLDLVEVIGDALDESPLPVGARVFSCFLAAFKTAGGPPPNLGPVIAVLKNAADIHDDLERSEKMAEQVKAIFAKGKTDA